MHIRYISILAATVITTVNFITVVQRDQSHIVLDVVQMSNKGGLPCPRESVNWDTGRFSNARTNRLRCLSGATKSCISWGQGYAWMHCNCKNKRPDDMISTHRILAHELHSFLIRTVLTPELKVKAT